MMVKTPPQSVLAVGAHPDDLEIQCGGTLARYIKCGTVVCMAIATNGSAGHMLIAPKKLARIRRQEAEKSAAEIDATLFWLGYDDELITNDIETRLAFVELIRQAKPDLIITHDPQDYHPDHRVVSRLVFDASFLSSLPNIKTKSPPHNGVQPLVYFDTFGGVGFQPSEYVDISDTFETKRKMLACHTSQVKWMKDHDQLDILELIELHGRGRGLQCGVEFAEAFRSEMAWPRLRSYRLLP
jgi:LmbE family N-acetylglucosaminyl deacetylase